MWCIPKVDGECVARMEDVLDLYAEAPDPDRPVVCFDESPVQLIGEVREPIPAEPGQLERYDCEYRRNGTVNLFVCLDVHQPWRKVKVTERRASEDYAQCMRELVDIHYPDAACIRVVQDNLSTHSAGSLYEAFAPDEARRTWSSTILPSTPVGSTWSRSRSACSAASASTAGSTTQTGSAAKSPHGRNNEMPQAPASIGCSQPTKPAPKWAAPIPSQPKSHNHCDKVLAGL
jgi:DDE superfamily endonuclease